ncbi:hypothetical protein JTB14_002889 [Gonioctena quinquepunctata]|nr:hypothetical protein JTB14_002889 [Gonioctena quinquepunctata]
MFSYCSQEVEDCELTMDNLQIKEETKNPIQDKETFIDTKALRMMEKMGYKAGSGLGKCEQGITKIIDVTYQSGKKGLGSKLKNLDSTTVAWDFSREEVNVKENVKWLQNHDNVNFSFEEMLSWLREGPPNHDVQNEFNFCDKEVLHQVMKAKDIFDELDIMELNKARARSNPFETIKSVFFMNRAALKMANIDAATDFMFSNIDNNEHHKGNDGPFYFADVCAGPGGFTEYLLWRKQWFFKGFGLTLKDNNDFRVNESSCVSHVTFQPLYGKDEDGNVCSPANIKDFKEKVISETAGQGVHFMMSDGGFSVEGNENLQEILSKNIYICQCLVALEIIRPFGHFVSKLFDIFTPFSVGLVYLMYKCFEKITILKPNSSRPANSERYLICSSLRKSSIVESVRKYLRTLVDRLWEIKDKSDVDVLEIVPLYVLKADQDFYRYIYETNQHLATRQIVGLEKLAAFCHNPNLVEARQGLFRKECLKFWNIPDKPKSFVTEMKVQDFLDSTSLKPEILPLQPREVGNLKNFNLTVSDVEDWQYCALFSSRKAHNINFYAAVGPSKVYRLQGKKWLRVRNLELCRGTLLYGEFVKEMVHKAQSNNEETIKYSLHVIDALRLGEKSLEDLPFDERLKFIKIYCKSVNRELLSNSVRIRPMVIDSFSNISTKPLDIKDRQGNKYMTLPLLGYDSVLEEMGVNSLLLLKTNTSQTFYSTYILRVQIFINNEEEIDKGNTLSLEDVISEVKQKL